MPTTLPLPPTGSSIISTMARPHAVLVVEDEAFVAVLLEEMLLDLGYTVIGPVASVHDALDMIATHQPAAAILDINLAGERSYPVADLLQQIGIPFAYSTGYTAEDIGPGRATHPVLLKPYRMEDLERLLGAMLPSA